MSVDVFFDTNVLIYATTPTDRRYAVATALLAGGGVISVQVLNEFVNVAHKKLRRPWPQIDTAIASFRVLCPVILPLGIAIHEDAVRLAQDATIHIYDALIVAAALVGGCSVLLTEDLQDGRLIEGRLTIRNPFLPA